MSAHLGLLAVSTAVLGAPDFPTKPIRMVVAGAVGSGTDILARQIGSKLTEAWGQPIVIDPRMGASGLIGAELVSKSAADGYTMWMATMSQLISTTLFQRLLLAREFEPVSLVATTPYVIAVNASVPVNSIAELINSAVVKALKTPEVQERFAAQGAEVAGSSPAEFGDFLRKESIRWGKVLRDANIRSTD